MADLLGRHVTVDRLPFDMMEIQRFGDVERIRLASWGSRLAGLDVSVYLLDGILIDSGFPHARNMLARFLDERRIAGAMLTHYHEDHAGNAALLAERGVPLVMHPTTRELLRAPAPIRAYRRVVWGSPQAVPSPRDSVDAPLELVYTPGHSADHQVVWDPRRATLFSGDLWLGVRARVMHTNEDPFRIVESLRTVLALRPQRMFDAHRGEVRDPIAAISAKIGFMEDTIAAIQAKLGAGWSERRILREVMDGEEAVAVVSGGEYSRMNFVRAVRRRG
jgi:glyoxylase-like metal-dependent hydrolase (beta-lactamase superfamily II)